jgi:Tol biopolymer transport system component
MFSPLLSPDGRSIAVSWNRRPARGVWVIDRSAARESLVYPSPADPIMPIGWSLDGRSVYAVEGKAHTYRGLILPRGETVTETSILMIPLHGGTAQRIAALLGEIGGVSMAPDGRRFVYTVYSSRSDIWIVDDFDTAVDVAIARR